MPPPTTSSTISTTTTKQENSDTSYHSETISVSFATTSSETEAFIATSPTGSTEFYSGTSQEHKNVPFNTEESEVIGQAILDGVLTDQVQEVPEIVRLILYLELPCTSWL